MKSILTPLTAVLTTLTLATAKTTTAPTTTSLPASTDASSFLAAISATPTWATGKYATSLATALYSIETSFLGRADYATIVDAIWSAAVKNNDMKVLESLSASYWNWGDVTTNAWYTANVPGVMQTEIRAYDAAYESAWTEVEATATATGNAAAGARATGLVGVGVAVLGAVVGGVM